ncbi:MAG: TetR/AcrR family transcriptional regulator [Planctomycetaceae bacterium]
MSQAAPTDARLAQIVEAARAILEQDGREALTMRRVADRLGIRAPSLYKHVASKEELEALLIAEALRGLGTALHGVLDGLPSRAGRRPALAAIAEVYRSWALAHPHLYRLSTEGELPRALLPEGLEAWTAEPLVHVAGGQTHARAAWAFAHGMTVLELDGRFPPDADLDAAWEAGVAALAKA